MTPRPIPLPVVRTVCGLTLLALAGGALDAQSSIGPYTAESFESHRYALGPLAGTSLTNGQDGWILFDSGVYPPDLAAAVVQDALVPTGDQAVRWDAARMTPGSFGELRRNALFSLTTGVVEIEFDFLILSSANPSTWEVYSQPYPMPPSCYLRWWIAPDGRLGYFDTPSHVPVPTGTFVVKDVWHHARTVVDVFADRFEVHLDGDLVASGTPIGVGTFGADHGFSQFNVLGAGDDALYFDNLTLRERTAEHGLSVDLPRLPIDRRSLMTFRLAGGSTLANSGYALVGSLSGTSPGTPIGSAVLPLNFDGFSGIVVSSYGSPALPGFLGVMNGDGNAFASFDTVIPVPAGLLGLDLDFAYVDAAFASVSEPVRVRVTP